MVSFSFVLRQIFCVSFFEGLQTLYIEILGLIGSSHFKDLWPFKLFFIHVLIMINFLLLIQDI